MEIVLTSARRPTDILSAVTELSTCFTVRFSSSLPDVCCGVSLWSSWALNTHITRKRLSTLFSKNKPLDCVNSKTHDEEEAENFFISKKTPRVAMHRINLLKKTTFHLKENMKTYLCSLCRGQTIGWTEICSTLSTECDIKPQVAKPLPAHEHNCVYAPLYDIVTQGVQCLLRWR